MRKRFIVVLLVFAAVIGFSFFGGLVWQVETETADVSQALLRFSDVRAGFESLVPMLQLDAAGRLVGNHLESNATPKKVKKLHVLAYKTDQERLVKADVPFWFARLKGPTIQFALRDTGFDLKTLGVTIGDLERRGPGLILDEENSNGDRLLVWSD